jgi:hypothetical protein
MIPILRAAAICTTALGLCAVLALLAGRALGMPGDARVQQMQVCAGQPCLMGIAPGVTTWEAAQARLHEQVQAQAEARRLTFDIASTRVETYVSVNRRTVGRIYLLPQGQPLSAGWIIQRYGVPCGVSIYYGADIVTLRYPQLLANIRAAGGTFDPDSPVTAVRYSDPHFLFDSQPNPCIDNITSRQTINTGWHGFVPFTRYLRAAGR